MVYLSPLGSGFLLFFKRFERENVKEEVIEFNLKIATKMESDLPINKMKLHTLSISVINES